MVTSHKSKCYKSSCRSNLTGMICQFPCMRYWKPAMYYEPVSQSCKQQGNYGCNEKWHSSNKPNLKSKRNVWVIFYPLKLRYISLCKIFQKTEKNVTLIFQGFRTKNLGQNSKVSSIRNIALKLGGPKTPIVMSECRFD